MSRIHDVLRKAGREGALQRTRALDSTELTPAPVREAEPAGRSSREPSDRSPAAADPLSAREEEAPALALRLHSRLVAALAPDSLAAEQYRSLRTRIGRAEDGRPVRVILVTSPAKGDGKTLSASNLALTMAQEFHRRVLLMDADLRWPSAHALFGLAGTPGLTEVLLGAVPLEEAVVSLPDCNLSILPAGAPPVHPADLLGSAALRRTLDQLRSRYDRILLDTPPVAPLADIGMLAPLADGVLLIVRAGVTTKPAIERALAGIEGTRVLGLVLNDAGEAGPAAYTYEPEGEQRR